MIRTILFLFANIRGLMYNKCLLGGSYMEIDYRSDNSLVIKDDTKELSFLDLAQLILKIIENYIKK